MRAILDTNILLSGLISPHGPPALVIEAWLDDRFMLVSHTLQIAELREVTRRPKIAALVKPAEAGRLVNMIARLADMPERLPLVERSPDPNDDFLLALCEASGADRLVTGDKRDLLSLRKHGPTHIVTASAFAEELRL